jgi:hypothetical protein
MALKLWSRAPTTMAEGRLRLRIASRGAPQPGGLAMRTTRARRKRGNEGDSRIVAIADAHLAAATAERLASMSSRFAHAAGVGQDDAHEVTLAAHRARAAAREAETATTDEEAWAAARLAWAAVVSAREADARIAEALVNRLIDG